MAVIDKVYNILRYVCVIVAYIIYDTVKLQLRLLNKNLFQTNSKQLIKLL